MVINSLKQYVNRLREKSFLIKTIAIFTGIVSTVWFLLRVIPKPSRASYPCMRAAAPIMSSFIIWTLSVIGMAAFYRNAKSNYIKSKYLISGAFAMAFLVCFGMFQSQNAKKLEAATAPLAATGTPKGIFIGRVAWVYNPDAAKWNGQGNFWATGNNQAEYNAAFTQGLQVISGGSGDADSWNRTFAWFNDTHARPGTVYQNGDKIAIKINQNNSANSGAGGGGMNANPFACVAVVASLVNAGVPQGDIWIGDPSRAVTDNIFNAIHTAYPNVNVVDYFGNNGRKTTGFKAGAFPNGQGIYTRLSQCFVDARYIISLPILKGHPGQNFSFGAKNFYGISVPSNNWANNSHPGGNDWESEYLTNSAVGGKVVLWCMDASYPCVNLDTTPSTNKGANFIMSLDGVAEESVSLDMWNSYYGKGNGGEGYIINAAKAGAGLQEHWDANKKYSRNLNPNAIGIELVYKTKPWVDLAVAITAPANNTSVPAGTLVAMAGTAKPEAGKAISKVEILEGTTVLDTAVGTTSWTYSWPAVAGTHKLTAKAYSTSGASITADVTINATVPQVLSSVVVTPTSGSVQIGGTLAFAAQGLDQFGKAMVPATSVTWAVSEGGTISAAGQFKGTAVGGPYTVTASAFNGAGVKIAGTATVKVTELPVLSTIVVTPPTGTVQVGNSVDFNAQGYDQFNNAFTATFTWSVATGGTIDQNGLFTGQTVGGPYTLTASAVNAAGVTITGTAKATVTDGPAGDPVPGVVQAENYIEMLGVQKETTADPLGGVQNVGYVDTNDWMTYRITVATAGAYTINFRVAGWADTSRIAIQDAAFTTLTSAKVPNGGAGSYQKWSTIPGEGSFVLKSGTQIVRIFAVGGSWNLNWFDIQPVPVSVLNSIAVTPASTTVQLGATATFAAQGYDQYTKPMAANITWSVTPSGTISGGVIKAPAIGTYTIKASSGAIFGTATLTVTDVPVLTKIIVTPDPATVPLNGSVDFNAQGYDQFNSPFATTFTWSAATGGTIDQNGLFTGLTSGGPYVIKATSTGISGEAKVTVVDGPQGDPIPGVVQAENYIDMLGILKQDTTDVGLGQNVGYTDTGDWMTYRVNVKATGSYRINFRVAGWAATGRIALQDAAFNTLTAANIPNGGAGTYQKWSTVTGENKFTLQAGIQVIRIYAVGAPWNLNWFSIDEASSSIKVEAENYSAMLGIQTQPTTDIGGGMNVGYTEPGDWMDYPVTIPADGLYSIAFRVASNVATGKIELRTQAGTALATLAQGTTTGWQVWVTDNVTANLTAGAQTLRVHYTGAGLNLNWFEISANNAFSLYLNPSTHLLAIETVNADFNSVEIRSSLGTLVMTAPLTNPLTALDVTTLAQGTYQVSLKGVTISTKTLVIQ